MNKQIKLAITIAVPVIIWFLPAPDGLSVAAWRLFGFYLAAILGLMLKPLPEPLVLLTTIAASAWFLNNPKDTLSGYASTTTWLVFCAFALSVAFVKTGLGHRIAYLLIKKFGSTMLGLGYVTAALDFIISPVTPSNTARAGGIVFPIINSVAKTLGSEPGETADKAGAYLLSNVYMVTKVTSFIFLTAMAPNLLAAEYMSKILGVNFTWATWAAAMIVPGVAILAFTPLLGYFIYRPTLKKINNTEIAYKGLAEMGPMKFTEKALLVIFIGALLGWAVPSIALSLFGFKIVLDATSVALVAMVACFLTGVLTWPDMLASKGAWNTLLWFGGIIGMSSALSKAKFFEWLAKFMQANIHFGDNPMVALLVVGVLSIAVRYLFASGTAYIVAMLPVFLTVGKVAGIDPMSLALVLAATNSYGGATTHYGGAAGPIVFGEGYNDVKRWWINGGILAVLAFIVTITIGIAWWKMIGLI